MAAATLPLFDRLGWTPRASVAAGRKAVRRAPSHRDSPIPQILAWSRGDGARWQAALDALTPLQRTTVRAVVAQAEAPKLAADFHVTPLAVVRRLERSVETLRQVMRGGLQLPLRLTPLPRLAPVPQPVPAAPAVIPLRLVPAAPQPTPPCSSCPVRSSCRALCAPMEAQLAREGMREEIDHHKEIPKRPEVAEYLATKHEEGLHAGVEIDDAMEPEERASWADIAQVARPALKQAIATVLPPKQREAVELLLSGTRQCDIARMRKVTKVTVCVMLRRARIRLARELRHVELPA